MCSPTACLWAGGIALLIPPSIILILFGIVTETSIVRLFFAGVVPGLLLGPGHAKARRRRAHNHRPRLPPPSG